MRYVRPDQTNRDWGEGMLLTLVNFAQEDLKNIKCQTAVRQFSNPKACATWRHVRTGIKLRISPSVMNQGDSTNVLAVLIIGSTSGPAKRIPPQTLLIVDIVVGHHGNAHGVQ